MLYVSKFGGSSVCNGAMFDKVKKIISNNPNRKIVVVSALGKRDPDDEKVTDLLYLLSAFIKIGIKADDIWKKIYERYEEINLDLNLGLNLELEFKNIRKKVEEDFDEAYLISRGEYLSAKLMSVHLGYTFVDSADLLYFNYDKKINEEKSREAILDVFNKYNKIVVPGFYGVKPNGKVHLFSRGGSDLTGAYLAAYANADKYENFTDVSGILMASPNVVYKPKKIDMINYEELRELSYLGASILHEETILPLFDTNIPIEVLNTFKPDEEGTLIVKEATDTSNIITGIAGKSYYLSITICKYREANKLKVMNQVFQILENYDAIIEHVPTSIDSFTIILERKGVFDKIYKILEEIMAVDGVSDVLFDDDIALVAVVGRNMVTKPGISGRIFGIVGSAGINIKMITQGAKELTIIMAVSNKDLGKTIVEIYDKLN